MKCSKAGKVANKYANENHKIQIRPHTGKYNTCNIQRCYVLSSTFEGKLDGIL